jgi:hypothetical protein
LKSEAVDLTAVPLGISQLRLRFRLPSSLDLSSAFKGPSDSNIITWVFFLF